VRLVELDADGEGVVTFSVPVSQGLELEDYEDLLSKEERDEALVRRKLMTEAELEEAMLEPYEENPRVAEEDAYEDELVGKLVRLWLLLVVMAGVRSRYCWRRHYPPGQRNQDPHWRWTSKQPQRLQYLLAKVSGQPRAGANSPSPCI
jgi:L-lysine 2,3-aminomutase